MAHHSASKPKAKPVPLSTDETEIIRRAFNLFSRDQDGTLDGAELNLILRGLEPTITAETLSLILRDVDTGSGTIDFATLQTLLQNNRSLFAQWHTSKLEGRINKIKSQEFLEKGLKQHFPGAMLGGDFVRSLYKKLLSFGFTKENTIAAISVCRDEICKPLMQIMHDTYGLSFELTTLAGMVFVGKTGFSAALHHAPIVNGRERYLLIAFPHIAIDSFGEIGAIWRPGRLGKSNACGALCAFLGEVTSGDGKKSDEGKELNLEDLEYSLMKKKLFEIIPKGSKADLVDVTKAAMKICQQDIEALVAKKVDVKHADYCVVTGVHIHAPPWLNNKQDYTFVWPGESYCVLEGKKIPFQLENKSTTEKALTPKELDTLRRAFHLFDVKADTPTIDGAEFAVIMHGLIPDIQYKDIEKYYADADRTGKGHIGFDDFILAMEKNRKNFPKFEIDNVETVIKKVKSGEVFDTTLEKNFPGAMIAENFVKAAHHTLQQNGFNASNSIGAVSLCRDEICAPVMELMNKTFGTVFGLTSLGGMVSLGSTGFSAALHHSPRVGGRERYICMAFPHIAIDSFGEIGAIWRPGRLKKSNACGALCAFLGEVSKGGDGPKEEKGGAENLDMEDLEYSYMKQKLFPAVPVGSKVNLVDVTKAAAKVYLKELEKLIAKKVDQSHGDVAVIVGVQIHGPNWINSRQELNYLWVSDAYVVNDGKRKDISIVLPSSAFSPRRSSTLRSPGSNAILLGASPVVAEGFFAGGRSEFDPFADTLSPASPKPASEGKSEKKGKKMADDADESRRVLDFKQEKAGKGKKKEEEEDEGPDLAELASGVDDVQAFSLMRQLTRATQVVKEKMGSGSEDQARAQLIAWQKSFENLQKMTKPMLVLDPHAPDDCEVILRKIETAKRVWSHFENAKADFQQNKARYDKKKGTGEESAAKSAYKESKAKYQEAEERLNKTMTKMEKEVNKAHDAAIKEVVDILLRVRPKWRKAAARISRSKTVGPGSRASKGKSGSEGVESPKHRRGGSTTQ